MVFVLSNTEQGIAEDLYCRTQILRSKEIKKFIAN